MNCVTRLIDRQADQHPDAIAFVGPRTVSFGQLRNEVNQAGHAWRALGCRPGTSVLVGLGDSIEFVVACLGAMKIGAAPVITGVCHAGAEFERYLTDNEIAAAVVDSAGAEACGDSASKRGVPIVCASGDASDSVWSRLVASQSRDLSATLANSTQRAFVLYTSGSTGIRKGAIHTHGGVEAACENVGRRLFGITPADRLLSALRLTYSYGFGFGVLLPLACGASSILPGRRWDMETFLEAFERYRPTIACVVPSFLAVLFRGASASHLDFSSLRYIVSAGEPLPQWIFRSGKVRHGVEILDGLGATELLSHVISNRPGEARERSCGVPVPGVSVQLVDERGAEVGVGEPGELRVRTPTAFAGYVGATPHAGCTRIGDWIATGDVLCRAEDGFLTYLGRIDDMCKIDGQWVSPSDVTQELRACPGVREVFVTAREDPWGRRRLVAYVVPEEGLQGHELNVVDFCGSWEPHAIPAVVTVLPSLPLLPNGKIDRRAVPDPVWRGRSRLDENERQRLESEKGSHYDQSRK